MNGTLLSNVIWFIDQALKTAKSQRTIDTLLDLRSALMPDE